MIEGVHVRPLRQLLDDRGAVLHMLRSDEPHFDGFGEVYFSIVYPGVVKGWHRHEKMTLNYAVPIGTVKVALFDDRPGSSTKGLVMDFVTGERAYSLITIPPGVWNGFMGLGTQPSLVANCASIPHDPSEITRMDPHTSAIPYTWRVRHR